MHRPTVTVIGHDGKPSEDTIAMPIVFNSPIRPDVVQAMHTGMAKNRRQPYAVSEKAGHQTSAESWGTGRAVARIPRVSGSGTHRAGQAAFGNMCRSGRMFAPTKTFRKWHQKLNLKQKRYATASAIAASASVPLLMARGHNISTVTEVPLVVSSTALKIARTSAAVSLLKHVGAAADIERVKKSRTMRAGKGKMRGRRFRQRRGPLLIFDGFRDAQYLSRSFRNVPGLDTCNVHALNLLQLAPGGHLGRFCIWTSHAFAALNEIYGTHPKHGKKNFHVPPRMITQPDINKVINSSDVQAHLRAVKGSGVIKRPYTQKKNPLTNRQIMLKLNPYAKQYAKDKLGQEKIDSGKPKKVHEEFQKTLVEA